MPGVSTPSRTSAEEISLGGCYIETTFTVAVGTTLAMKLWLDDVPIKVSCVVVTCHPQFGNGFEFLEIGAEDRERLAKFIVDNASTQEP